MGFLAKNSPSRRCKKTTLDYLSQVLIFVCLFAILAGSFNLLVGFGGLFSLAHAGFFGLGAYVVALLTASGSPIVDTPFNLLLATIAAVLVAACFGLFIAIPALRVHSDYLVVLSFGFQMVIVGVFLNWIEVTGGEGGVTGVPRPVIFGLPLETPFVFLIYSIFITAIAYFILWRITESPFGRMLKAIRDDQVAAESLGKNVVLTKILVFAIASGLAGLAGVVFAQYVRVVDPMSFQLHISVEILAMLILGGTGNMMGSALGALILMLLPEALRFMQIGEGNAEQIRQIVFGSLLIAMLRFRSQGILPEYWRPAWIRRRDTQIIEEGLKGLPDREKMSLPGAILKAREGLVTGTPLLVTHGVSKSFGGIQALKGLSLTLEAGKITGLIGPNGAGKTTAFNLMTGFLAPDQGEVKFKGQDITRKAPHLLPALGIARSFQNLRLFYQMTVLDNVMVARPNQGGENLFRAVFNIRNTAKETARHRQESLEILHFAGLAEKAGELAENLSYAEEKLLGLARMMAMEADLLLLDEPASGLDPQSVERMFQIIRKLVSHGKTVCIIEHNLDVIKELSDKIVYLDEGMVFAEGAPEEILKNPELAKRYFGA